LSSAIFPTFLGRAYSNTTQPTFDTLVNSSTSGRDVRVLTRQQAKRTFEVTFEFLTFTDKATLDAFFKARFGGWDDFLFDNFDDDTVAPATPQAFATADGATLAYQLPFYQFKATPTLIIYDNGVAGSPTISGTGLVTYSVAPLVNHVLSWSGGYYYRVTFQDKISYSEIFYQMWQTKVTLQETLAGCTTGN
jgi:hypothetical protein